MQDLNQTVIETESLLKKAFKRRFRAVIWAFSGKKSCLQLCQRLDSYKSTMGLILTISSITIGQSLDQRTGQILAEIQQLRLDLPDGENIILQRFLEDSESYAESFRDHSTVADVVIDEDLQVPAALSNDEVTLPETAVEHKVEELTNEGLPLKDVDRPNPIQTSLYLALRGTQNLSVIQKLLNDGATLSARDQTGRTALDHACLVGIHHNITAILDAEFAGPLINGATLLHRAAYLGDIAQLSDLLRRFPLIDVNVKDDRGITPLHLSCQTNREEVVVFLLRHGADCRISSQNFGFPLGQASFQGMLSAVRIMLEQGANVYAAKRGWTPYELAAIGDHAPVCELLRRYM
ncbi:ankyrin repeat-containing domain protein [Clohesyomyces aquaticus]|uniref:Ankyrin repeat-containing domain protein n=1 Tax=Clohesyomyces aquaticus TaxID=1231657 RepID=A0A1Y1ZFJ5_9PLEO|nr:ankyrin repeat-containing domain protein [Clohesyomyces aquaticus]